MKAVLDTNVLVAAIAFGGICRAVTEVCIDSNTLILSEHILTETERSLIEKLKHPADAAIERVELLREAAQIVLPHEVAHDACRDPDDLPILGTVVAVQSACLVTGDNDLLTVGPFHEHPILTPRQFWQQLR